MVLLWGGLWALAGGVAPNLPGFLVQIQVLPATMFPGFLVDFYHYAWFIGFTLSSLIYFGLMRNRVESVEALELLSSQEGLREVTHV